jgi:mRNA-degrading endonuclease RelE of RelBE toxin-antitoxin system
MILIETHIFTRKLKTLLSDDEYRKLQHKLVLRPDAGDIIPGSGGLRKLRWAGSGRGKSGGVRVIYYWFPQKEVILMLFIYPKSEQDDLTSKQLKTLKNIIERTSRKCQARWRYFERRDEARPLFCIRAPGCSSYQKTIWVISGEVCQIAWY